MKNLSPPPEEEEEQQIYRGKEMHNGSSPSSFSSGPEERWLVDSRARAQVMAPSGLLLASSAPSSG